MQDGLGRTLTIDMDGRKLKKAIDRLVIAGVIDTTQTRTQKMDSLGGDEIRLFNLLHSDPAVLHFVKIGRAFQMELHQLSSYPCENAEMNMFPELST